MATVYFSSLEQVEVIEVQFVALQDEVRLYNLLVDSGFTGRSSAILGRDAFDLIRAQVPAAQATGALSGAQERGWVTCRIPALDFQATIIAIITDIAPLALPTGVHGMVGLNFLRQFARWGAEQYGQGWRFFLSSGND